MTSNKSLVLVILFSMYGFVMLGQNSGWDWVQSFGGVEVNRYDYADPGEHYDFVACDASNNIYVAGDMLDTAIAGDIELRGNGDFDVVVAKLNPQGQYIWATNLGGPGMDAPAGLSLDSNGNAYLTGIFSGTLRLGGFTLQSRDTSDAFVAKINAEGIWQWIRQVSSQITRDQILSDMWQDDWVEISEICYDIQTNAEGSSVVLGITHALTQFGSHTLNSSGEEWFLASIDTNGEWLWAKNLGESIEGEKICSLEMTLDQDNNVITVASTGKEIEIREAEVTVDEYGNDIRQPTPVVQSPTSPGYWKLAKHDQYGETLWEKPIAHAAPRVRKLITDNDGGFYIAGLIDGLDSGEQDPIVRGISFVSRVDSLGSLDWFRGINADNHDRSVLNLALGSDSRLYVVSDASNLVSGFPYRAIGSHHAMLSAYNTDGSYLSAQSFGEEPSYVSFEAPGLALDKQNRIIISGSYGGAVSLGKYRLNSDNWGNAFVGRFVAPSR